MTLPIGVDKTIYVIGDTTGDAQTNNITITPNSGNINGSATYVIKNNYGVVALQYSTAATEWKVIGRYFTKVDAANELFGLIGAANGGTGIANNAASTLTISGSFATTLTVTGITGVTLPTTGTLSTLAGSESLSNKTLVTPVIGAATGTSLQLSGLTASKAMVTDGSKNLASSAVTSTELGYLSGVTTPTGSGALVLATTPTLVTPVLGVATATSINKVTITAPASSAILTIANGKTLTVSNTLTFTGTDTSSVAFGAGGTAVYTSNDLSVFASTTSLQLKTLLSDETGSGSAVFATSPALVTPTIGTQASFLANGEVRFNNSGNTFYTGFKGGEAAANKIWILPLADGTANQVLSTNGSGTLSWASGLSSSLNQYNISIGDSTNTAASTNTNLLGDAIGQTRSQTATMTIAAPGVVTSNSHGMALGDKFYFTTTGALPTGVTASTTYYASAIATNTFNISTSITNAIAGTYVTTTGSQSGVHTLVMGGVTLVAGANATNATRMGLMQYLHGTTYNASAAPTVTGTNWTTNRGVFIPYQMLDGTWRIRYNVHGIFSSGTATGFTLTVNGVTSFNGFAQSGSIAQGVAVGNGGVAAAMGSGWVSNSSTLKAQFSASIGINDDWSLSGDIELASKPTWAY